MLISVPRTTQKSKRTIAISTNAPATTYYTVPDGKTFKGNLCASAEVNIIIINATEISIAGMTNFLPVIPLTLQEGDVIGTSSSGYSWNIIGEEY